VLCFVAKPWSFAVKVKRRRYAYLWYLDENLQIPRSQSEVSLKFSEGYTHIKDGKHDEDEYEACLKIKGEYSNGYTIEAELEGGWTWGAKHEDLYSDANTTSFGLKVERNGSSWDRSIGVFSFHVLPKNMQKECTIKREIPIEEIRGI
jgi:hypothetical protein